MAWRLEPLLAPCSLVAEDRGAGEVPVSELRHRPPDLLRADTTTT